MAEGRWFEWLNQSALGFSCHRLSLFYKITLLWHFLALCGFVQVACQGFLVRLACVGVLVSGAVFLLSPFEDLGCFLGA